MKEIKVARDGRPRGGDVSRINHRRRGRLSWISPGGACNAHVWSKIWMRRADANRCAGRERFFFLVSLPVVYVTQKMVRVARFTAIPAGHELGLIRSDSARFGRLASRTLCTRQVSSSCGPIRIASAGFSPLVTRLTCVGRARNCSIPYARFLNALISVNWHAQTLTRIPYGSAST